MLLSLLGVAIVVVIAAGKTGVVALRRFDALVRPPIQRDQEGPQRWGSSGEDIRQILASARSPSGAKQADHPEVREARVEVEPHVVRCPHPVTDTIGDVEGGPELPEFKLGHSLENQWIGGGSLEDSVANSGNRVRPDRIGHRRGARRDKVVPVVLVRIRVGIGKLHVGEEAMRAGNVDVDRIEDLPVRLVLVEPLIEPVSHVHPGGGATRSVGPPDASGAGAQRERVRIAGIIVRLVAEKRPDVARHRVGQTHHHWVFRWVDELVDFVGSEPVENAYVGRVGDERCLSFRAASECPAAGGDRHLEAVHFVANRQCRVGGVHVRRLVRAKRWVPLEGQGECAGGRNRAVGVLDPDGADDRAPIRLLRHGQVRK